MGFNFPPTPNEGESYTSGGVTFVWNGYGWTLKAPDAPVDGKIYGRKNATWAEIISDVTKSYVDTQDALRVAKTGDTMTGSLVVNRGANFAPGNVDAAGLIAAGSYGGGLTFQDGAWRSSIWAQSSNLALATGNNPPSMKMLLQSDNNHQIYGGLTVAGKLISTSGDVHARYGSRHGTFRFGDADTDRYVTHDGTNTHWNIGGTMYMNVPLTNVHAITVSGHGSYGSVGTAGVNLQGRSYAYIGWQDNSTAAAVIYSGDPGWDAFIAFHRLNFACYFGLRTDNALAWGGWSHGNSSWRIWSERDCGHPIYNAGLPYAGDVYHGSEAGVTQPYGGAVVGGAYSYGGGLRYRYLQFVTSSWWTIGYSG